MCFYQTSCSIGLPKIEMKNKNGTTQGGLDGVCVCDVCLCACVLGRIKGERLTEKDTVFVTVGIVSKHMYIHVQKQISDSVSTKCSYSRDFLFIIIKS